VIGRQQIAEKLRDPISARCPTALFDGKLDSRDVVVRKFEMSAISRHDAGPLRV
jgi:hypothetical protein